MSKKPEATPQEKVDNLKALRAYQEATLASEGPNIIYSPRMFYKFEGVISFTVFPNELQQKKDIYTEKVDSNNVSEDDNRVLYKWNYNPDWAAKYAQKKLKTGLSYMIPESELEVVPHVEADDDVEIDESVLELTDPDIDSPMSDMTIRDYYAITHQKPVSQRKWLNELITKTKNK